MKNIAIFASGSGTNAQRIIDHFEGSKKAKVILIACNNPRAFVLERARKYNIPILHLDRKIFFETDDVVHVLREKKVDLIILAGFLWLIPGNLISAFANRIINIHPALLPKYGGKGMYGMNIHEAVIKAGEKESGITIHYVNENYDEGEIIFQQKCMINTEDTAEALALKIHELEYEFYPKMIEKIIDQDRGTI